RAFVSYAVLFFDGMDAKSTPRHPRHARVSACNIFTRMKQNIVWNYAVFCMKFNFPTNPRAGWIAELFSFFINADKFAVFTISYFKCASQIIFSYPVSMLFRLWISATLFKC